MTERGERLAVLAVFVLALVLRVVSALEYEAAHPLADRPVIDELSYEQWGREIARGEWLGDEVFFQEPLYPYWIGVVYSVLGESRTALRHVQAGLGALTCLLVWVLARRLFGRGPALVAATAWALYRPALLLPSLLLKPNLFLPVLTGLAAVLVAAVERGRRPGAPALWLAAGVLAGLGALLRGNVLLLLPLLALTPLLALRGRRALLAGGALVLGVVAVLAPVAVRNHVVGGVFALTTSGAGTNVYGGNNAQNPHGTPRGFDWVRGIPEFEAEDWKHEAERRAERELTPTEVSSFWLRETWESLKRDPGLHASILWNKLRLTLGSYEVPDNHHLEWDARFVPLLRLPLPGWGLAGWLSLAGAGVWLVAASRERGPLLVALLAAAYLGTIVLTVTSMRVRIALVPLLLPFGGWLLCNVRALAATRRGALAAGAALLVAGLFVAVPVFDAETREQKLAVRDFNLLTYALQDGTDVPELHRRVVELDRRYPRSLRVISLRAEVEFRMAVEALERGERDRAGELVETARARLRAVVANSGSNARERHRARVLAGELARFAGDPRDAEACYRAALEFDPTDAIARRGRADALLLLAADGEPERLGEAADEYRRVLARDGEDRAAKLGLANALFLLAGRDGADRAALLAECERLLSELEAAGEDVGPLLRRVRDA